MKIAIRLAMATAIAALCACGSHNNANNSAELNAATDLNAGSAEMNATGNSTLNAAGGAENMGTTNAAGNTSTNAGTNSY